LDPRYLSNDDSSFSHCLKIDFEFDFEKMVALTPKALIATSTALVAGATYIDAQLAISRDVKQVLSNRRYGKAIGSRFKALENNASAYGHLLLADPNATALWFEGRNWTYAEVTQGMQLVFEGH
jgi:hypothetical protein